jgi:hypothetical protein
MIKRADKLGLTRNLAIKHDSEAMKVFNSGKTGGRGDHCGPKLRWLDNRDRNTVSQQFVADDMRGVLENAGVGDKDPV